MLTLISLSVITDPLVCVVVSSVYVLAWNFFPRLSLSLSIYNEAEIPSGVRRDWRGTSAQCGVEAFSPWLPQCAQPCRTLHRRAAGNRMAVGKSQSTRRPVDQSAPLALTDWQMGIDARRFAGCAIFETARRVSPLSSAPNLSSHPIPSLRPRRVHTALSLFIRGGLM